MNSKSLVLQLDGYSVGVNKLDGYQAVDTFNTMPVAIHRDLGFAVAVTCPATGSPQGTVKIQACNDTNGVYTNEFLATDDLVNWIDVPSGGNRVVSGSINGASAVILTDPEPMYRWFRVVYTRTSGTITVTMKAHIKADR